MSALPEIDPLQVAQKTIGKLENQVSEYRNVESTLETLAEALRDERDEFQRQLEEALNRISELESKEPVADITTLDK